MNPITQYQLVEMAWPWRLRGPSQQQSAVPTGVLYTPGYSKLQQAGGTPTELLTPQPGIELGYFSIHNRSGAAGAHGIGVRIPNHLWMAGQWTAATTTFTDDTTDAQSTATTDVPLETTTNDDGFIVLSRVPFNAISIDVATASGAGTATRLLHHSNRAGTGWTAQTNPYIHTGAAQTAAATGYIVTATTAANEALVVWDVAEDWGITATSQAIGTGIPGGYYAFRVSASAAPTTAGAADSMSIYRLYWLTEGLADNGTLELTLGAMGAYMESTGDALVPLFETANDQNRVIALVRGR